MTSVALKNNLIKVKNTLFNFVYTDYFILTVGIICLLSHLFGLEIIATYLLGLFAIFILVFCQNRQPLLPILFMVFHFISIQHGSSTTGSYDTFTSTPYVVNLSIVCFFVVVALVYSVIRNRRFIRPNIKTISIIPGMIFLTLALLLNGINIFAISPTLTEMGFGNEYSFGSTMFGLLTAVSFFVPFLYLWLTSEQNSFDIKYLAKNMTAVAILISVEVLIRAIVCLIDGTLFLEGTHQLSVSAFHLGWGFANNVAAKLIMVLPMVFYLAIKEKRTYIYYIIAVVSTICIALTQSRNAMLFSIPLWIVAIVLLFIYCKNKKQLYICLGVSVGLAVIFSAIFFQEIKELFWRFLSLITDSSGDFADNGRFAIWKRGLQLFTQNPIFGVGFVTPAFSADHTYIDLYNNLYHNIVIQMLASCGIIGLIAMYQHFVEVFKLFKKPNFDNSFILINILTLLAINLLDVHMFLSSCSLFYSVYLVYAQQFNNQNKQTEPTNKLIAQTQEILLEQNTQTVATEVPAKQDTETLSK